MFKELKDARKLLERSLERYVRACATARDHVDRPLFSHTEEHSTHMATEIKAIFACEGKIGRARKLISQAINHSPFVARINILPDEVLVLIFHMALGLQPCFTNINDPELKDERTKHAFAQIPENLSHVCTRWRRVAFGMPTLWQHIDINTDATNILARANSRLSRAGRLLLDVHMIGSLFDIEELEHWIASAAPRMRSLTLIITDKYETHEPLLTTCLRRYSPGTLTHLTIWKETGASPNDMSLVLHLGELSDYFSESEFADIYRRFTSLRLRQVYPSWTNIPSELLEISISQIVTILQSSPKLRVLRFDLKIIEVERGTEGLPVPVHLEDLEVLDLSAESRQPNLEQLGLILRLFTPGAKPLQLTIDDLDEDRHLLLEKVVQDFFSRSNVTRLKLLYDAESYKELDFDLLSHLAPQLQHFVLEHFDWGEFSDNYLGSYPRFHDRDNSAPNSHVEYLCLHRCHIDLKWCPKLLSDLTHPPRVLVFWRCRFTKDREDMFDKEAIRRAFREVSQDVRVLKWHAPKPPDDWYSDDMPRLY